MVWPRGPSVSKVFSRQTTGRTRPNDSARPFEMSPFEVSWSERLAARYTEMPPGYRREGVVLETAREGD